MEPFPLYISSQTSHRENYTLYFPPRPFLLSISALSCISPSSTSQCVPLPPSFPLSLSPFPFLYHSPSSFIPVHSPSFFVLPSIIQAAFLPVYSTRDGSPIGDTRRPNLRARTSLMEEESAAWTSVCVFGACVRREILVHV